MPEAPQPAAPSRWLTLEAMAWLVLAKLLVRFVRFGRWRGWLGQVQRGAPAPFGPADALDHLLGRVVDRAAMRLPFPLLCLPRAMALQWMLLRRGRGALLVIGVRPGQRRGGLDDLHAWVERSGTVLIGESALDHTVVLRIAAGNRHR